MLAIRLPASMEPTLDAPASEIRQTGTLLAREAVLE